jgi:hypothetical protein
LEGKTVGEKRRGKDAVNQERNIQIYIYGKDRILD